VSGGSYDYLFLADHLEELVGKRNHLEAMADLLEGVEWGGVAARHTRELVALLDSTDAAIRDAVTNRLGDVWHAAEWWQSSDYGEDQAREAAAAYAANHGP
jgi:hypothetical protein